MCLRSGEGAGFGFTAIMLLLLSSLVNGSQMFQEWKLTLFLKSHLTMSRTPCHLA